MTNIAMQRAVDPNVLLIDHWTTAIVGNAVDARGRAAIEFATQKCQNIKTLQYNSYTSQIEADGENISADQVEDLIREIGEEVLIDATTLGFVETFLLCKAAKDIGMASLSLLYVEPVDYNVPETTLVLQKRDFNLSEEVEIFSAVPCAALLLRPDKPVRAVFFLGFEGQRLEQALEQTDVRPSESTVIFGVPAYQAGWEMNAFHNNIRIINERQINEVLYSGAQNPAGAYTTLQRVHSSCTRDQRLLISPIGTKPHGIGAALYAVDNPSVGLIYDHPVRRSGRSKEIAAWHLFTAYFDNDF